MAKVSNTLIECEVVPQLFIENGRVYVDLSVCEAVKKAATIEKPKMELLSKKGKTYTEADVARAKSIIDVWTKVHGYGLGGAVPFILAPWGGDLKIVRGPLERLGTHIRDTIGPHHHFPLYIELHPSEDQ